MNKLKYYFCAFFVLFSMGLFAQKERTQHAFEMNARIYITAHGLLLLECEGHTYIISSLDHSPNCECKQMDEANSAHDRLQRD